HPPIGPTTSHQPLINQTFAEFPTYCRELAGRLGGISLYHACKQSGEPVVISSLLQRCSRVGICAPQERGGAGNRQPRSRRLAASRGEFSRCSSTIEWFVQRPQAPRSRSSMT